MLHTGYIPVEVVRFSVSVTVALAKPKREFYTFVFFVFYMCILRLSSSENRKTGPN